MSKKKHKVKEEKIEDVFEDNTLHTMVAEEKPKKEVKPEFERRLEELAKKFDPIKEWGKFYAEVKKNKYFGKTIDELLKWRKNNY